MAQDSSKAFFHCFNFPPSARESCIFPRVFPYLNFPSSHSLLTKSCIFPPRVPFRVGHADIFADAHQCGYLHYPTYVGYSAIYAAHISDRHPIRIRMTIPSLYIFHPKIGKAQGKLVMDIIFWFSGSRRSRTASSSSNPSSSGLYRPATSCPPAALPSRCHSLPF